MKSKTPRNSLIEAKEYAFLLLKYRMRSEGEIRGRLKRKNFSDQAIDQTLSFLKEKRFINDEEFARLWTASRIRKPLGVRRIRQELKTKGIDRDIIEQCLADIADTYSEEETVREILRRKMVAQKEGDPQKVKRRLYAYLARRGFSPDVIGDALATIQLLR